MPNDVLFVNSKLTKMEIIEVIVVIAVTPLGGKNHIIHSGYQPSNVLYKKLVTLRKALFVSMLKQISPPYLCIFEDQVKSSYMRTQ